MILDPSEVLTWLGKASTASDAEIGLVNMLLPMVERSIRNYVGCELEPQATYTHYLPEGRRRSGYDIQEWDVRGGSAQAVSVGRVVESRNLFLPERPVRSITSVNVDAGAAGGQGSSDFSGDDLTSGTDFFLDNTVAGTSRSGKLIRKGSVWPSAERTVKVVYVAGYTQAEMTYDPTARAPGIAADVKLAALIAVQNAFAHQGVEKGAVKSERLGDYWVTYAIEKASDLPARSKKYLRPYVRYSRFL